MGIYINPYGTAKVNLNDGEIAKKVEDLFEMRPYAAIEQRLILRTSIYIETAAYGHMGRESKVVEKIFNSFNRQVITQKVELFAYEKLDYVEKVKQAFGI